MEKNRINLIFLLKQYTLVLLALIVFTYINFNSTKGNIVLGTAVVCYGISLLAFFFCKKSKVALCILLASVYVSTYIIGYQINARALIEFFYLVTSFATIIFMCPKITIVYTVFCNIGIITVALWDKGSIETMKPISVYWIMALVYGCATMLIIKLVWNMTNNINLLREKMKEAVQANKSKSEFLANMSHEIRTPMNAISGMTEIILRDQINEQVRSCAISIQNTSKNLLEIINDILDISKVEAGKMELIEGPYEIAVLLNDVINLTYSRLGGKKLHISYLCDPSIPYCLYGDDKKIKQVIINIMTNAIKYTKEGSIVLKVYTRPSKNGVILCISVKDTGIGIKEEDIEKIFDNFTQADSKENRKIEGTGLGLSIVKKMVELMHGFIMVDSVYKKGSEFTVSIPQKVVNSEQFVKIKDKTLHIGILSNEKETLEDSMQKLHIQYDIADDINQLLSIRELTHVVIDYQYYIQYLSMLQNMSNDFIIIRDREDKIVHNEHVRSIYKPIFVLPLVSAINNENISAVFQKNRQRYRNIQMPRVRILVVDDNEVNLLVVKKLLEPYKATVDTTLSGISAIEMVKKQKYDLIFMDHMMPEMDGIETTKNIRNLEGEDNKSLPIIALSANAVYGVKDLFVQNSMNDFLSKPIIIKELEDILIKYIPNDLLFCLDSTEDTKPVDTKTTVSMHNEQDQNLSKTVTYFDKLTSVNVEIGITNSGGNVKDYLEILKIVQSQGAKRMAALKKMREDKDYKAYTIDVHALKSTAANIGATELSSLAKKLEMAGQAQNYDIIESESDQLLQLYEKVLEEIQNVIQCEQAEHIYVLPDVDVINKNSTMKKDLDEKKYQEIILNIASYAGNYDFDAILEYINKIESEFTLNCEQEKFLCSLKTESSNLEIDSINELINQKILE